MSSRSLDDLDPRVKPKVESFLAACKAAGIEILVTCTLRTYEEQAKLYAQGRTEPGKIVTRAKPGQSAHNAGLALDVVPLLHGKPVWDFPDPLWSKVGALGQEAGLQWYGAPGAEFVEAAHFQLPHWKDFA